MIYEFQERTLEQVLRHRRSYNDIDMIVSLNLLTLFQKFEEQDAWNIIRDLVAGLKAFRDLNLHHGDIQPANIYVLNNKSLKLIDVCFMNDEKSGFMRKFNEFDYQTPLSPQALGALMLGPDSASFDKEKNDIWSLGITLLTTFVNEDYNNYYDWKNFRVNDTLIRSRILKLSKDYGYSSDLINLLDRMLEMDDFKRIGIQELSQIAGVTRRGGYNQDVESMYRGAIGGGDFLTNLKKVNFKL